MNDIVERVSVGTYFGIDTFSDDDRVVDDNSEHNDETEQADHIDRDWPDRHQPQSTEKGYWQSDDDPERDLHAQKQRQHDKHQNSALDHVVGHHVQTRFEVIRQINPRIHLDTRRQRLGFSPDIVFYDFRCLKFVLLPSGNDLNGRSRATIEAPPAIRLGKAVSDRRDIA